MKLDQIAYYAHNDQQAHSIKMMLKLTNDDWVEDIVTGKVHVYQHREGLKRGFSAAKLMFCYKHGIELEILQYIDGPHWHDRRPAFLTKEIFISHHGFHLDEDEPMPTTVFGYNLAQEMWTETHTNQYLIDKRRTYHYRIFDTVVPNLPSLKFIKRIEPK